MMETLAEARNYVVCGVRDGVTCPCCGQRAKLHRLRMNKTLALLLRDFYDKGAGVGWVQCRQVDGVPGGRRQDGMHAKLRFWGLLEPHPESFGYWRVTERGRQFVEGRASIPSVALIYNKKKVGLDDETMVSFKKALEEERFAVEGLKDGH